MFTQDLTQDPLTAAWAVGLSALAVLVIGVPVARLTIAGLLYLLGRYTRRPELRHSAARMVPRFAQILGAVVMGSVTLSAPAQATGLEPRTALSLDRDGAEQLPATANATTSNASHTSGTGATAPHVRAPGLDRVPTSAATGSVESAHTRVPAESTRATQAGAPRTLYVVRNGDTLWDIAAAQDEDASNAEITATWKAIWRANRAVIGEHPEIIHPGQALQIGGVA